MGDLECGVDFGFDSGVEASEGIVAGEIGLALLVDVVAIVLLTDGVNSGQDVDDTHC